MANLFKPNFVILGILCWNPNLQKKEEIGIEKKQDILGNQANLNDFT